MGTFLVLFIPSVEHSTAYLVLLEMFRELSDPFIVLYDTTGELYGATGELLD